MLNRFRVSRGVRRIFGFRKIRRIGEVIAVGNITYREMHAIAIFGALFRPEISFIFRAFDTYVQKQMSGLEPLLREIQHSEITA